MRAFAALGMSMALILSGGQVRAQEMPGKTALPRTDEALAPAVPRRVTLGRPEPLNAVRDDGYDINPTPKMTRIDRQLPAPIVRAQSPPPPPPPPASPFGGPAAPGIGLDREEAYKCGVVNDNSDIGSCWDRMWGGVRRCYEDVSGSVGGMFQGSAGRKPFQSDRAFEVFTSPVSNPFYFEDPRALTEVRPIFIWQQTRGSNYIFAGGDNVFAGLQARVAFTERISLVINKLGWIWMEPHNPTGVPGFDAHTGFSELHLGPKFTIIRNDGPNPTVAAVGLQFEIPAGPQKVFQNTGNLSLTPYFSIAQNFGKSSYGSFNFMNTTGYSLGIDSQRTDFLFSSFHFDYNVGNLDRFFPMIELNWAHYTFNGSATSLGFEGRDLFNFGSDGVAGHDELTLAVGGRVKINNWWQFGLAGEFSVIGGGRHLDAFRLTADMIFRY